MPVPSVIGDLSTTASSNSPVGGDVPGVLDDHLRAQGAFIAQLRDGTGFSGTITAPTAVRAQGATQGIVGTRAAGGSGQTANGSFNDMVIDASSDAGLTILTGNAARGALLFGDADSNARGRVQYDHATDKLALGAAGTTAVVEVTASAMSVTGKINAVTEGAGSGETADSNYNNIVIDSADTAGITILSGATSLGGYRFGRLGSNAEGGINYNHATDALSLIAGGVNVATLGSVTFDVNVALNALSLSADGQVLGGGGVGFTSPAGGTVTQATSKSTAVTLNKNCGRITMNNAALAGGAVVSFDFNNATVGPSAIVVVGIRSGAATGGSYHVSCDSVGSPCRISVRNLTGGSLSEALVLTFAVFDGSDS